MIALIILLGMVLLLVAGALIAIELQRGAALEHRAQLEEQRIDRLEADARRRIHQLTQDGFEEMLSEVERARREQNK